MIIGILTLRLHIPVSGSLKAKRRVVKSLKDRLRNKFNVSISALISNLLLSSSLIRLLKSIERKSVLSFASKINMPKAGNIISGTDALWSTMIPSSASWWIIYEKFCSRPVPI